MRTITIVVLFTQIAWSQISNKEYKSTTREVIQHVESNNIENALELFVTPTEEAKNELKKAMLRINSLESSTSLKEIELNSKDYFIHRYIYKSKEDEVFLILNFYYKKDSETALIERLEVKDKNIYISNNPNIYKTNRPIQGGVPPSTYTN